MLTCVRRVEAARGARQKSKFLSASTINAEITVTIDFALVRPVKK